VIVTFDVFGVPRPQGSLSLWRDPKTGRTVSKYAQTVYEWRGLITAAARAAHEGPAFEGAVALAVRFDLPRPKSHFGTGRNAGTVKPSAPSRPAVAPDLDKLLRAIGDAVTDAGTIWADDGQIVTVHVEKHYIGPDDVPGCTVTIEAAS
jgi:crossover junction endodeoxyribonuclease RusA